MFEVMTVCTGNICRSPLAEALLKRDLPADVFTVSSSGIKAVPSGQVPPRQVKVGQKLGVSGLEEHIARYTTGELVERADLLLSMSRGHRKHVLRLDPSVARRSFTIREFARLAGAVTPDDVRANLPTCVSPLHAAVEAVAQKRGLLPPPESLDDLDVVDPYRQRASVYRKSRDELVPAAEVTAQFLNQVVELFGTQMQEAPVIPSPARSIVPELRFPKRSEVHGGSSFGGVIHLPTIEQPREVS